MTILSSLPRTQGPAPGVRLAILLAPLAGGLLLGAPATAQRAADRHNGPEVADGPGGPARYVGPLYESIDPTRTMEDTAFIDRFYRTPGGPGYNAVLDRLEERLREAGFGSDRRLTLHRIETQMEDPSWYPISASLMLRRGDGSRELLLAFASTGDAHRTMLPVNAPDADSAGRPVFSLGELENGAVLVTRAPLSPVLIRRAERAGAVAILSAALFPFTEDPTGKKRHQHAIKYAKVSAGTTLPVAQISPHVLEHIEAVATKDPEARVFYTADVGAGGSTLHTLVAEIVGTSRPNEAVAIASHVQEPGAGDNASGVAGLCAGACAAARLLQSEELAWPDRTLAFVWGDEMQQSRIWLDSQERTAVAGLSSDMLGQSRKETGAVALLERTPDPGALFTILPDEHTPWGAGAVQESDLRPNGLNVIARSALVDVARYVGGWETSENPWEGGSDHDVFLSRGIPAILLWHFTDFTYHTSLDRMDMIDVEELRRTCVAIVSAGLAIADPRDADLERHLASNELERELRVREAKRAKNNEAVKAWNVWCDGAAEWLKRHCAAANDK